MHLFLKTDNFLEETGQFLEDFLQTNNADDPHSMCQKQSLSTTSIMDRQLLRQKVCQKISVIKTNICDDITNIVHFGIFIHVLSWRQQKQKLITDIFDKLFDVIIDDP